MANIDPYLSEIKSAIYGEDVRNSIIDGMKAMNNQNNTLETDIKSTTQNTLDNFRVYTQVNALPLVGDPQVIYCVSDIVTADSDSGICGDDPSSTGAQKWDEDQTVSYFTNSTARIGLQDVDDYIDESIVKPVMARYYINDSTNLQITDPYGPTRTVSIQSITLSTCKVNYSITRQGNTMAGNTDGLLLDYCIFGPLVGRGTIQLASLSLVLDEFIYDATDERWKYNRTITKPNITTTKFIYDYGPSGVMVRAQFQNIYNYRNLAELNFVGIGALPSAAYTDPDNITLLDRFSFSSAQDYVTNFESKIARLCNDSYGYDTYNHSVHRIIEVYSASESELIITSDTQIPIAPNKWKVIISSSDRAFMYVWNQALERYIELVGAFNLTPPEEDGTYVMKCTVSDGAPTYAWVAET